MANNTDLPEYLWDELNSIANNNGFIDYTLEQDVGSKHGDGFMAVMVIIKVKGTRSVNGATTAQPDELNLICKLLPSNAARRELFNSVIAFEREVVLYNTILPALARFQDEKGLTAENGFYAFPKCYFAVSDTATDQHAIIMDDLRPEGFVLWDKLQPIEYENVRLLMAALGRLHALSFAIRDQRPELFATFHRLDDVMLDTIENSTAMESIFKSTLVQSMATVRDRPEDLKFLENSLQNWRKTFRECLTANVAEPFAVVGHGDCWNNNMMFRSSNDATKPDEIILLDWQISRLGSPALDLSYFFMSSTAKPLRDQHFDEFLHIYHSSLSTTLQACGSDPDALFSFENLQDQLKEFGKFGVLIAPMLLTIIVNDPSNIEHVDNFAESTDDKKTMAKFDTESEKRFVQRLTDVINDSKAYGWVK